MFAWQEVDQKKHKEKFYLHVLKGFRSQYRDLSRRFFLFQSNQTRYNCQYNVADKLTGKYYQCIRKYASDEKLLSELNQLL